VAYPLSYRQLEAMMRKRGVSVDHSPLNRWVTKYAPKIEKQFRHHQHPAGKSWHLEERDVKIRGRWASLYRAVDKGGRSSIFC